MAFLDQYLSLIAFTSSPGSNLETLRELHKLHTFRFPFENLTPFLHEEVKLDEDNLRAKFLEQGRGGYCFEQNLLFARVLREIGFKVTCLGGRVLWNQPENFVTRRSHMLLLVEADGNDYICDVGFGGLTQTQPLLFVIDKEQETTHEIFKIGRIDNDLKMMALVGNEWKTLYRFDLQEQFLIDYDVANFYLFTHPSSIFRNNLMAGKPFEGGRIALNNNQLSIYENGALKERRKIENVGEMVSILSRDFNIRLPEHPDIKNRLASLLHN